MKTAPAEDGICNEMIKHMGPAARKKQLELFGQSWNTSTFLKEWKEAAITPILKKQKDSRKIVKTQ